MVKQVLDKCPARKKSRIESQCLLFFSSVLLVVFVKCGYDTYCTIVCTFNSDLVQSCINF